MGKVVDVTLRLIDNFTSPLNSAGKKLAEHTNQWQRAGKQITNVGKNISNVGKNMTKAITVPVAAAGVGAIKLASDFESGMSKVQSISSASAADIEKLGTKAKEMGLKTKFSATESTEAYSYMAMAGWKTQQMIDGLEGTMYLAGATGEDLAKTSDIVTDNITAFGLKAKDTNKFVDVMAATANNSNTNVSMLGESFKYCAPLAGAMKYNVQDVSVALGLMANSGIKASASGTAMRSWLTRMAKPTKESQAAMDKLGLSLTDKSGKMKDLKTIMAETRKGFSGLTSAEKSQYAAMLAGKTGMSGLLAVVNSSDGDFNKLTKSIYNSDGACKKMYETANDNLKGSLTKLKSTVESIGISFGQRLTPYVKNATKWLQSLAEKFNNLTPKQQDMVIKIALVAAAIGPALIMFGKLTTSIGKTVKTFSRIGKAFKTFGSLAKILTSPAGIVIGVIAAIAVAAYLIIKNWDKLKPYFNTVASWFKSLYAKLKPIIDSIKTVVKSVVNVVINLIKSALKIILPVLKTIFNTIKKQMPTIKSIITKVIKALEPQFKMAAKIIKTIANVISKVLSKAIKAVMPVLQKLGKIFSKIFSAIASVVSKVVGKITAVINKLRPVFEVIFDACGNVLSTFGNLISDVFSAITKIFDGIIDFVSGIFTGNWKKAWEGVKNIFGGIFDGLKALVKTPINYIIDIVNACIKGLNKIKLPDWVPLIGGKGINIPLIPKLAKGTNAWKGGIVQISEKGGEIVDLPNGSRVYPHDKSVSKAFSDGQKASGGKNITISIAKLAEQIVVREEADIDKIADKLANKLEKVSQNLGGGEIGYIY